MTTPQPNPTDDLEAVARLAWPAAFAAKDQHSAAAKRAVAEAYERARAILNHLRPAGVGEAVAWPEREKDLRWLEWQKETGHCGESTSEAIQRGRINGCIDRILKALATPAHPDAALMERVRTVLESIGERGADELGPEHDSEVLTRAIDTARALLSDLKAEAGR